LYLPLPIVFFSDAVTHNTLEARKAFAIVCMGPREGQLKIVKDRLCFNEVGEGGFPFPKQGLGNLDGLRGLGE
jgi:hypothetical protein